MSAKEDFDASEYTDNYTRCVNNQISLMERHFLIRDNPSKDLTACKSGIKHFYTCMRMINFKMEENGYEPLPYFWFKFEEGNA
jgi:hypothetical protein